MIIIIVRIGSWFCSIRMDKLRSFLENENRKYFLGTRSRFFLPKIE
jgi:hypothetical protein